ncbi:lipocalin-like domain-containing protein [Mycolicibacterium komossense]|uniref:lipocalin-like domain-containing protein n=1 Tax=Mycolicibacterium komossense TaxID=1779 RepID=UPI0021F27CEB|nr:lipocalin-like domain-containing protein [Mycolicibacterium komossense]
METPISLLRNAILGTWELESFVARDAATGDLRHPLGERPRGLILYTEDGFMSAQLAPQADADTEISAYIAYSGPFHLDEQSSSVRHDMQMATMPELLHQPQIRQVHLEAGLLILSASTTEADRTTVSTLTWRRPSVLKE